MEADWSILQRQTITDHLMEVVVVVAVFLFYCTCFHHCESFSQWTLGERTYTYEKIRGESEKMGPERLWGQQIWEKWEKLREIDF